MLVLLSAERAYVASLAPAGPTSATAHSSKSIKQQTLARLQKALSYLPELLALPSVASSPTAVAQATIYQLLLQATRALKRDDIERALEGFAFGLLVLCALEPKLPAVGAARLGEWAERDFTPALRFCAYKLRSSAAAREVQGILDDFAPLISELEQSFGVPATVLDDVKALPDASADDKRGGTLSWLGQTRQVQNARLVGALARLATARAVLADKYAVGGGGPSSLAQTATTTRTTTGGGGRKKGLLKAFDRVLLAARSGLDVIDATSAAGGSDGAGGNGLADEGSSTAFVGDYLAFVQASTLIQRDLHLVHHLLPSSLPIKPVGLTANGGASSLAATVGKVEQPEARTLVKVVRLLGAIVGQWETIGSLASVERGTRGEGEAVEVKVGWFRAVRYVPFPPPRMAHRASSTLTQASPSSPPLPHSLYFLSLLYLDPHPSLNSPPKALALLPVLTLLLRQVSNSLPSPDSDDDDDEGTEMRLAWPLSEVDPEPVEPETIFALEQRASLAEVEAKDQLWHWQQQHESAITDSDGEPAAQEKGPTFLDLAVNFVDLDLREDLPVAPPTSTSVPFKAAPPQSTTARKLAAQAATHDDDGSESDDQPFDDAQEADDGEEEEEEQQDEDEGPKKKGWLGGWFGRS